jgi:DNA repair protein RecN (Recombination protein N)
VEVAQRLAEKMARELSSLGMQEARFEVLQESPAEADRATRLRDTGIDTIEFYLSANPGEEAKPLSRVASGGELSRVMLALKALTVADETPILIFDEVDAGIGGAVADAVARRLKALAETRQLLCITHLPQIAAYADHHFAVEKQRSRGRTITQARALADDERVVELSRMLGGTVAPAEAERYAKKLVAQAQEGRATR